MLCPRCLPLAATGGRAPGKRILCSGSVQPLPCSYIPVLGSQQTKYPVLWPRLYLQHLFPLRPAKVTWTGELPCNNRVRYNISLAVVEPKAQLYMKQTSGRGKELWGLLGKALMSTMARLIKMIHPIMSCVKLRHENETVAWSSWAVFVLWDPGALSSSQGSAVLGCIRAPHWVETRAHTTSSSFTLFLCVGFLRKGSWARKYLRHVPACPPDLRTGRLGL